MNVDTLVKMIPIFSLLIATITLIFGVVIYKRQVNAQLFIYYAKRYEEIMSSFPPQAKSSRLKIDGDLPESSQEITTAVLRYLNLCSEEYYLYKKKYLSNGIWKIWENELKRTLKSPLIRREWRNIKTEFDSYPKFVKYVEDVHVNKK